MLGTRRRSRWFSAAPPRSASVAARVTPRTAGWRYLEFQVRRLQAGEHYRGHGLVEREQALVLLGGICTVHSSVQSWTHVGRRPDVWSGLPWALYLPPGVSYTLEAETPLLVAISSAPAAGRFPPRLITPADVEIEVRGGGNATRQINHIIKPAFPAGRLLIVEVYTPAGSWSSYPPHKHDEHNPPAEVVLEEVYYYQTRKPEGCAIQRLYTADGSLDETFCAGDGDLVLVPRGYHPVVALPESDIYYLNVLTGDERSMAASDDPAHAWIRSTWPEAPKAITLITEPPDAPPG